ncbi:hypothetical protein AAH678_06820 [Sodalis endosymbiont of Spalangia cameroni]|uniref:DUF7666 domain-containing protein n=1 Tax=Sodalis praecaptivus TaxID=1239307 RepID=UPI0031F97BB5
MSDNTMTKIIAYKGFNADLTCRDYQFEIGKTYQHEGAVDICSSGFHACEYPLDAFGCYEPANHRFAEVEVSGDIAHEEKGNKLASSTITIKKELSLHQMADRAVEWTANKIDKSMGQTIIEGQWSAATNTGNQSAATNTGHQSVATNTGDWSAAANTGHRSAAINTGYWSAATNSGYWSAATNTGSGSAATNTGDWSAATTTGDWSAATNTGNQSAAANTGDQSVATNTGKQSVATNTGGWSAAANTGARSAATNTGDWSAATNTGDQSVATNTGNRSAATNTGYRSASDVSGIGSVAASLGERGKAKAAEGGAIVLCYRNDVDDIIHIRASKVGDNGVKPDTWYVLNANGEFEEADD